MNRSIIEDTNKEIAFKLSGLLDEEAESKIAKLTDLGVLGELHTVYFQGDKDNLKRLVQKRITELGGIY